MKEKRNYIILLCISFFSVIHTSCSFYKLAKHTFDQEKILPSIFRIEKPIEIDSIGYYCIRGLINNQNELDFIIDTRAPCLMKSEDLEQLQAKYWTNLPMKSLNAYGQKNKTNFYTFDSLLIPPLSFNNTLFKEITQNNKIYKLMYKSILGNNVLSLLNWKFLIDDGKMILFSKKDSILLKKETDGFIKIKNGVGHSRNNPVKLIVPSGGIPDMFKFDLGYMGEIRVNKKTFATLSLNIPYKKILTYNTNDTTYLFDKINIQWDSIIIPSCQIIHDPDVNMNLIGAAFMHRFNFILAYNDPTEKQSSWKLSPNNLYIQPSKNFYEIKNIPFISDYGFNIKTINNIVVISRLEINGLAESAGLKIRDHVLSIDNGTFDISAPVDNNKFIDYLTDKKEITIKVKRGENNMDVFIHR